MAVEKLTACGDLVVSRAYVTVVVHGAPQRVRLVDAGVKAAFRLYPATGAYATARQEIEVALAKRGIARMVRSKEPSR